MEVEPDCVPPLSRCRLAVVGWADLPPELLAVIVGHLQYSIDVLRFRSVCRPWRLSTSPPPNKIVPLLPHRVSFCLKPHAECKSIAKYLVAGAVYLLRPHGDPSKAWMVSVREFNAGELLLRHALKDEDIAGSLSDFVNLSEWSVTRIAISYSFRVVYGRGRSGKNCSHCQSSVRHTKVIFVSNSDCGSEAMALYNYGYFNQHMQLCSFGLSLSDQTGASQYVDGVQSGFTDFVNFNGRIYAVDSGAHVYLFDSATSQLLRMNCGNFPDSIGAKGSFKRFVVSDGDLYMVLKFCVTLNTWCECRIYKLVIDDNCATSYNFEKVENLGDRVFFINYDCGFSVSHRDLPNPLKGNCVIVGKDGFPHCFRFQNGESFDVYHLGGKPQEFGLMSSLKVYSALFTPPSLSINQRPESSFRRGRSS